MLISFLPADFQGLRPATMDGIKEAGTRRRIEGLVGKGKRAPNILAKTSRSLFNSVLCMVTHYKLI